MPLPCQSPRRRPASSRGSRYASEPARVLGLSGPCALVLRCTHQHVHAWAPVFVGDAPFHSLLLHLRVDHFPPPLSFVRVIEIQPSTSKTNRILQYWGPQNNIGCPWETIGHLGRSRRRSHVVVGLANARPVRAIAAGERPPHERRGVFLLLSSSLLPPSHAPPNGVR